MIGPLFIHIKKDFEAYHFFASCLVNKKPELAKLHCYGTDGEAALVNAFSAVFPKAIHLRCFLHFRENIVRKLQQLRVPTAVIDEFKKDIFGNPQQLELGLVDSESECDLDAKLKVLKKKWDERETPFNSPQEFHSWFMEHGRDVVATTMIRPVRETAGLGSPPQPYYTNDIESKNNILKQHLGRKASGLPEFVESMKDLISEQRSEVERAVAMYGSYRIISNHSNLSCDRQKWFKMTEKQRQNKVSRFLAAPVQANTGDEVQDHHTPLDKLNLPSHMKNTIWSRAQSITTDKTAIVAAPGDESAYVVKSLSGQRPHYVRPSKAGGFICDSDCLGYTSAIICAHTVAASLKAGKIGDLVTWYLRMKCKPNLTSLADSGKPASAGKKPRKGVTKKVSKKIQSVLDSADEHQFTSRVHSQAGP